jgi:hypothetical protein
MLNITIYDVQEHQITNEKVQKNGQHPEYHPNDGASKSSMARKTKPGK